MAEPTSALSFYDLILRVAKEAGIAYYGSAGDKQAMIPIDDASDLDLCKMAVNDAIRMFIADAPPKGWRWMRRIMSMTLTATRVTGTAESCGDTSLIDSTLAATYKTDNEIAGWYIYILTGDGAGSYAPILNYDATSVPGTVNVTEWFDEQGNSGGTPPEADSTYAITPIETINGDITRYPLAENFGGEVNGSIEYIAGSGHGAQIQWCSESQIRARQAVSMLTSYPRFAAIRPLEYKSGGFGPKRRFELILDKKPSTVETVEFPYTLFFDKLRLEAGIATSGTGADNLADDDREEGDDYFNGWKIEIISGTGKGSWAIVADYTSDSGKFDIVDDDWLKANGDTEGTHPETGSVYVVTPVANLHPAGFRFDQAVLAACLAQAEMEVEEIVAGWVQKYAQKALPKAYAIDVRSAPRKLSTIKRYPGRQGARLDVTTPWDI